MPRPGPPLGAPLLGIQGRSGHEPGLLEPEPEPQQGEPGPQPQLEPSNRRSQSQQIGQQERGRCARLATDWLPLGIIWLGMGLALSIWPYKAWGWQSVDPAEQESCAANAKHLDDSWLSASTVGWRLLFTFGSFAGSQVLKLVWQPQLLLPVWAQQCCSHDLEADDPERRRTQKVAKILQVARTPPEERESATPAVVEFVQEWSEEHERNVTAAGKGLFRTLWTGHGAQKVDGDNRAGWKAITDETTPQSTWGEARRALGLSSPWQAFLVSATKFMLWHISQPVIYLYIFGSFYCTLSDDQQGLGSVVAAREIVYMATSLAGVFACPSYLLLDLETVWNEAETTGDGVINLAMYILTPQNYLAKCLINKYCEPWVGSESGNDGSDGQGESRIKRFALGGGALAWVGVGLAYGLTNFDDLSGAVFAPIFWAMTGAWVGQYAGYLDVGLRRGPGYEGSYSYCRSLKAHNVGASGLGGCLLGALTVAPLGPLVWAWVQSMTHTSTELFWGGALVLVVTVGVSSFFVLIIWLGPARDLPPAKVLLGGLVLVQVVADFASCFALGLLLGDNIAGNPSPFALKIGYAITALGFLLFFGPLSVLQSYRSAVDTSKGSFGLGLCLPERCRCGRARCEFAFGRVLSAVFGLALFLGWVYVILGGALLSADRDVFCDGYFFGKVDCGEHGTCQFGSCDCTAGWIHDDCGHPTGCDYSARHSAYRESPCRRFPHSECKADGGNHTCVCTDGWKGVDCDHRL